LTEILLVSSFDGMFATIFFWISCLFIYYQPQRRRQ